MSDVMLSCSGLSTELGARKRRVKAVRSVSLAVRAGEIFGLVGESGCGKSTLARTLLGLERPSAGTMTFAGRTLAPLPASAARRDRAAIQYVHQDAGAALDPWWSIGRTLDEGLRIHDIGPATERQQRILHVLDAVGLGEDFLGRYPHELSGGQQRRIGLARILVLQPRFVILDEPTAGLDLSVQASTLSLILELRARLDLTILFISHDLSVVRRLCDRVAIMYLGEIVETADAKGLFETPRHPYTRGLLAAAPSLLPRNIDTTAARLTGEPSRADLAITGCAFRPRCPIALPACAETPPSLRAQGGTHEAACHAIKTPAHALLDMP